MFVPAELIPQSVSWTAWLLWVFALSAAAISAPWHAMRLPQRQHLFFASLLGLMLLWRLEAGVAPGLGFHFLAVTTLVLMFGWSLAVIGASLIEIAVLWGVESGIEALAPNVLIIVLLPATVTALVYRLVMRYLPHEPFVYMFVCAFFGGVLAAISTVFLRVGILAIGDTYSYARMATEYLPFLPLYAFPEGVINGMIVTVMVVVRPEWLRTFHEPPANRT